MHGRSAESEASSQQLNTFAVFGDNGINNKLDVDDQFFVTLITEQGYVFKDNCNISAYFCRYVDDNHSPFGKSQQLH